MSDKSTNDVHKHKTIHYVAPQTKLEHVFISAINCTTHTARQMPAM